MTNIEACKFREVIERLLDEDRRFNMKERRSIMRQPCFRPATIMLNQLQTTPCTAFVRDISEIGIGLVHDFSATIGQLGYIGVHRVWDDPVVFRCEVRWCEKWGNGWFLSGWKILSIESD